MQLAIVDLKRVYSHSWQIAKKLPVYLLLNAILSMFQHVFRDRNKAETTFPYVNIYT
jgi:hypothetical protein